MLTNLFGADQVTAFVTSPASGNGSCRLYLSTLSCHEVKELVSEAVRFCEAEHEEFIPLMFYRNRWAIEIMFYELKKHWNLESYMVRSITAMDLLLNLIVLAYTACKLLPYMDRDFKAWRGSSPQQVRLKIGKLILQRIFLYRMAQDLQTGKNRSGLEKAFGKLLVRFAKLD